MSRYGPTRMAPSPCPRFPGKKPMKALSLEKACDLLETTDIPGSAKELDVLRTRIEELLELNGEGWIRDNRRMLLDQWRRVVEMKIIRER